MRFSFTLQPLTQSSARFNQRVWGAFPNRRREVRNSPLLLGKGAKGSFLTKGTALGEGIRTLTFTGLALALAACSPAEKPAAVPAAPAAPAAPEIMRITDIDFASYSRDIARFVKLEIGEDFTVSKTKMETYFVPGKGISEDAVANERREGPAEASFSTFGTEGGTVIVADRFNMADDSVKAEQMYAISKKKDDGSEVLVDFGMKIKCWRGEALDAWGTNLCP